MDLERLNRALNQKMYLLDKTPVEKGYEFMVEGSTGTNYKVSILSGSSLDEKPPQGNLKCTCPDFYRRHKLCKHILFIVCRVYKSAHLLQNTDDLNVDLIQRGIDFSIDNREPTTIDSTVEMDCCICYETITGLKQKCSTCSGVYDSSCINMWLSRNKTCPCCRSRWSDSIYKKIDKTIL